MATSNGFPIMVQEGTLIKLMLDNNTVINIISERPMLFESLAKNWGAGLYFTYNDNMYTYYYNNKRYPKYKGNKVRYIRFAKDDVKVL